MMKLDAQKLAFFKQTGWLVITTTASGILMYAVHIPTLKVCGQAEYGAFTTMLGALNLMLIPGMALQTVFTKQTAAARTPEDEGRLSSTIRGVLAGTFLLWMVAAAFVLLRLDDFTTNYKLSAAGVIMTLLCGLPMLWMPIFQGLLQGSQNFAWYGWSMLSNGLGRLLFALILLYLFHMQSAGSITAAFLGFTTAVITAVWPSRQIWLKKAAAMDFKPWFQTVIPLTAGMAAAQVMFSVDAVFIRKFFSAEDSGLYGAAGTIARGLVTFTGPMAAVMFPKLVRSAARGEKTNVLQQTLLATGVLAIGAAIFCTMFPILLFQILNKTDYFVIAPLVPWFAWCMAPLTLANVLVNNLLARSRFAAIPWLVLVAGLYWFALQRVVQSHSAEPPLEAFRSIVQVLGCFNLLFLGVSWFFNWRADRTPAGS